jgi:flagellar hook-length control protein FliK
MLSPTSALNMSDISTGTTSITRSAEGMQLTPQHPNWGQELGDRVQWMIGKQMQSAEIRLNPPELGALEVKIRVQGDQATVSFTSPHGVVRDAIDAAMPRLRDMLAESGINLADVHVSSQSHGQQQQHSAQSQGSSRTGLNDDNLQPSEVSLTTKLPLTAGQGMLDVYA